MVCPPPTHCVQNALSQGQRKIATARRGSVRTSASLRRGSQALAAAPVALPPPPPPRSTQSPGNAMPSQLPVYEPEPADPLESIWNRRPGPAGSGNTSEQQQHRSLVHNASLLDASVSPLPGLSSERGGHELGSSPPPHLAAQLFAAATINTSQQPDTAARIGQPACPLRAHGTSSQPVAARRAANRPPRAPARRAGGQSTQQSQAGNGQPRRKPQRGSRRVNLEAEPVTLQAGVALAQPQDVPCHVCKQLTHPDQTLLCDGVGCGKAWHNECLPEGSRLSQQQMNDGLAWLCPLCLQQTAQGLSLALTALGSLPMALPPLASLTSTAEAIPAQGGTSANDAPQAMQDPAVAADTAALGSKRPASPTFSPQPARR